VREPLHDHTVKTLHGSFRLAFRLAAKARLTSKRNVSVSSYAAESYCREQPNRKRIPVVPRRRL